jgi:hypothetical protein
VTFVLGVTLVPGVTGVTGVTPGGVTVAPGSLLPFQPGSDSEQANASPTAASAPRLCRRIMISKCRHTRQASSRSITICCRSRTAAICSLLHTSRRSRAPCQHADRANSFDKLRFSRIAPIQCAHAVRTRVSPMTRGSCGGAYRLVTATSAHGLHASAARNLIPRGSECPQRPGSPGRGLPRRSSLRKWR